MAQEMPWEEFKGTEGVATPSRGVFIPDTTAADEEARAQSAERRAEEASQRAASGEARSQQAEQRAQAEFAGEGGKPTEAQQKTATLLTRIKGGFSDIQNVIARNPNAQEAGLGETLVQNVFGEGLVSRAVSGDDRRIVKDAQKDVLDALLTLGTGAAYTPIQLEAQTFSYFPQYNDTQNEIDVKNMRMQRLIESAKINAGPKWGDVEAAITPFMGKPVPGEPTTQSDGGVTLSKAPALAPADNPIAGEIVQAVPAGYQAAHDAFLKANPRGSLRLEDFTAFRRQLADQYGLNVSDTDSYAQFVSQYNNPKKYPLLDPTVEPASVKDGGLGEDARSYFVGAANALTVGLMDELAPVIGMDSTQVQAAKEYLRERNPFASIAGEIMGGVLAMAPIAKGAQAFSGSIGAGRAALAGDVAYGASYGAGETNENRLLGAALGGGAGALGNVIANRFSPTVTRAMGDDVVPVTPMAGNVDAPMPDAPLPSAELETIAELGRKAVTPGIGQAKAKRELAKMAKVNPEAAAQAESLGIELPTDILSDDVQLQSLMGLARSQVGSEAETAWKTKTAEVVQKAEDAVRKAGASEISQVSDDVFINLESSMEALQNQGNLLRRDVDEAIDIRERVDANNLQTLIAKRIADLGGIDEAMEAFSPQEKSLMRMLGIGDEAKNPTYARLNQIRDDIGEARAKGKGPWADVSDKRLGEYYAALAQDQIGHIETIGGVELADKMQASNALFKEMFDARADMVSVFGRDLQKGIAPLIRNAVKTGSSGDATALRKMVKVLPADMRKEVLLTGLLTESMANSGAGGFSFNNFAKLYRGIRDRPPIYKIFAEEIGDGDKILADLYGISKRMIAGEAKVLKTGKANQAAINALNGESLTAKVLKGGAIRGVTTGGGALVGSAGGLPGAVAGGMLGEGAAHYISKMGGSSKSDAVHKLLSSQSFKDTIEKVAAGDTSTATVNALASSKPFNTYADKMGISKAFRDRSNWIKSAITTTSVQETPQ